MQNYPKRIGYNSYSQLSKTAAETAAAMSETDFREEKV